MFGWIHESLRQLITRKYGTHAWDRILDLAKFKPGTENEVNHYYDDQESMRLISAIANIVELTVDEVWEEYGRFLIIFTMETGWNELLRAMAFDLQSFLDSLDALHYFIDHVVYKTKLKGPSFRCEAKPDGTLLLHYYSRRRGLFAIVKGLVTEAAQQLFSTNVVVTVHERVKEHLQAGISEHVVFLVQEVGRNVDTFALTPFLSSSNESFYADKIESAGSYQMTINDFNRAFPLHLCFDRDMVIEHCGL
uniref:Heme NO-binding domain-containing protein n=1 Tax=Plectus sambesii TaxID=2011161 RepID=A0A914WTZ5_9BILA